MLEFKWWDMLIQQTGMEDIVSLRSLKNKELIRIKLNKGNRKANYQAPSSI